MLLSIFYEQDILEDKCFFIVKSRAFQEFSSLEAFSAVRTPIEYGAEF